VAVTEVTDQNSIAGDAKIIRRDGDAPWGVEDPARRKLLDEFAPGVEYVDESITWASAVVVLR
jgi:hypothetical protein